MDTLIYYRNVIIEIYKKFEHLFIFLFKLIVGFFLYSVILSSTHYSSMFSMLFIGFISILYLCVLAFSFAILPITLTYLLIIFNIGIALSSFPFVSGFTVFVLLCTLVFFARLAPKESILIFATVAAFYLHIPYLIPLFAGIYISLTSCFQIAVGCFLWALLASVNNVIAIMSTAKSATSEIDPTDSFTTIVSLFYNASSDMLQTFILVNKTIIGFCFQNTDFIYFAFAFVGVVAFTFFVNHSGFYRCRELALLAGTIINFIFVILISIFSSAHFNFFTGLLSLIISSFIMIIIMFFDNILDYDNMEKVMFQDESNYYYVKVIPKIGNKLD